MTPATIALITITVFITAAISGTFGMAGGMIMMVVLLHLLPLSAAVSVHAFVQLVSNGWRCWLWRKHIVWKVLRFYALGMLAGTAVALSFSYVPDKAIMLLMIGIVPPLAIVARKIFTITIFNNKQAFFAALCLTFIHLTGGVVGALLDLLYNNTHLTRHQIVATKAFTQIMSHTLRLIYFGTLTAVIAGEADWPEGMGGAVILMLLVASVAGTSSAALLLRRIDDDAFKAYSRYIIMAISFYCLCRGSYMIYAGAY